MDQFLKLKAMHELIMGQIAAEAVIQAGVIHCGWKRDLSVQEIANALRKETAIFERQIDKTFDYMRANKLEFSKDSIMMFQKDKTILAQTIIRNQVDQKLFAPIRNYIHCLERLFK